MIHFDFQVGDLDTAVPEAVALGATVARSPAAGARPGAVRSCRLPFCLCFDGA
ncbi:VOC family protein [Streptomyces rhizoryzae]|uniref:VOC family protein n=1 Tax=Streptomyces rhizoryzae TaxID=2932493 RepID=UPI0027E4AD2D|nr:VOC family protein [Streptomyces rhizoryzae]